MDRRTLKRLELVPTMSYRIAAGSYRFITLTFWLIAGMANAVAKIFNFDANRIMRIIEALHVRIATVMGIGIRTEPDASILKCAELNSQMIFCRKWQ